MGIVRSPLFTTGGVAFGLAGAPRISPAQVQLIDSVDGGRLRRRRVARDNRGRRAPGFVKEEMVLTLGFGAFGKTDVE